ncbi:hypothetical protein J4448_02785 [Candidatus Woesearchaeota archaeon]|nr:hypothetical protein [Candidatus Woesearchaeota archaeon]
MRNERIVSVDLTNPYLIAIVAELIGLNNQPKKERPKPEKREGIQPVPPVYHTYDSQGRLPKYGERPPQYVPIDLRV